MRKKHLLLGTAAIFAAVLVTVFSLTFLKNWEEEKIRQEMEQLLEESKNTKKGDLNYQGQWYNLREDVETVLLIGLDKFEQDIPETESYRNHQQSDFLALLILDHEKKVCDVLSINRDTMADMTKLGIANQPIGTVNAQLALAHTYGSGGIDSCLNTVDAVSNFLYGTKIDHYLSVTMDAVPLVNDAVGGVTLVVEEDFSAVDPSLKQGEEIILKGNQALTYVRGRKDVADNSNINRMERQKQYLAALYEQMQKKLEEDSNFMLKLLTDLSPYMVSDYSISQVSGQLDSGLEYELGQFHSIAGESVKGVEFMEFYADDEALKEQLVELLYEEVE